MANEVDVIDVFYLVNTLTPAQIRTEIKRTRGRIKAVQEFEYWPCSIFDSLWVDIDGEKGYNLLYPRLSIIEYAIDLFNFDWEWWLETLKAAQRNQRLHSTQIPSPFNIKIDVDRIKTLNDILSIAEGYTSMRKSGRNYIGSCPLHEDRHPSFIVYPDEQRWHCYQCNRGGDVISLVMEVENVDFRGAAALLGAH